MSELEFRPAIAEALRGQAQYLVIGRMDNSVCGTWASLAEAEHSNEEATWRDQTDHDLAMTPPGFFPGWSGARS